MSTINSSKETERWHISLMNDSTSIGELQVLKHCAYILHTCQFILIMPFNADASAFGPSDPKEIHNGTGRYLKNKQLKEISSMNLSKGNLQDSSLLLLCIYFSGSSSSNSKVSTSLFSVLRQSPRSTKDLVKTIGACMSVSALG